MKHTGLEEELAGVLADHQLELDDLDIQPAGKRRVVRVTVDGDGTKGRGPDLDQIAEATRAISQALDDTDALGNAPYTLEVSSRGVSRPLTKPAHYRRNKTRLVALTLSDDSQLTGRIGDADDSSVTIDVDGVARTLGFDEISKAVVQVEMNRRLNDESEAGE
ncbi:ribosome maturation factor RimP [Propionimicrobium sp. PCR01-08-3]|uniref:ribosome maturation factor RimP n=1 Tax=Propionimicrobium sp. PCR01-08-3 TaxID=3052086 RepID=UPI00255D0BF9|nr:ribosome maturation factor RimP [Propionimicrobium sp. PCR01-08-3]WIY81582.1 ribosome maturation factor RimP [Propionimicrobium sp. PCR01-08-3]